jgi:hypothetical protein
MKKKKSDALRPPVSVHHRAIEFYENKYKLLSFKNGGPAGILKPFLFSPSEPKFLFPEGFSL